jgi:hypothetical protein
MILIIIFKEIGVKLDSDHVPISVEKVMKVRLTYYGAIEYETTELVLTINRTL